MTRKSKYRSDICDKLKKAQYIQSVINSYDESSYDDQRGKYYLYVLSSNAQWRIYYYDDMVEFYDGERYYKFDCQLYKASAKSRSSMVWPLDCNCSSSCQNCMNIMSDRDCLESLSSLIDVMKGEARRIIKDSIIREKQRKLDRKVESIMDNRGILNIY